MGLLYFAEQRVELAVLEVGLGGRLDATNVVAAPMASLVTAVSTDHVEFLGPSIAGIAREKAGIFKRGCPAVIARQAYVPLHTQLVIAATREPVTYVPQASEATLAFAAGRP